MSVYFSHWRPFFNANIPKKLLPGLLLRPVTDISELSDPSPPVLSTCCPHSTRHSVASGFTRYNLTPHLIRPHPLSDFTRAGLNRVHPPILLHCFCVVLYLSRVLWSISSSSRGRLGFWQKRGGRWFQLQRKPSACAYFLANSAPGRLSDIPTRDARNTNSGSRRPGALFVTLITHDRNIPEALKPDL